MTWCVSFHIQNKNYHTNIVKIDFFWKKIVGTTRNAHRFHTFPCSPCSAANTHWPNYESPNNLAKVAQTRPMQGYRIQDRFKFWMPRSAFRTPGTGYQIPGQSNLNFDIFNRKQESGILQLYFRFQIPWIMDSWLPYVRQWLYMDIIWIGFSLRAIFVWCWNENAQTKQK